VELLRVLWINSVKRQNAFVFTTGDCKRAFLSACEKAKLNDVHFHDLRHSAITRMLEKGISPPLVMKISGHTQQKTFLRYVNQSEDSVYEIAMILDRAA
jgi:integrase